MVTKTFKQAVLIIVMAVIIFGYSDDSITNEFEQQQVFQEFWDIYDHYYPLMHRKSIEWQDVYDTYFHKITSTTTDEQLHDIFNTIITTILKDGHSYISYKDYELINYTREANENVLKMLDENTPGKVLLMNTSHSNAYLSYGVLVDDADIGYIVSKSFEPVTGHETLELNAFKAIVDEALSALQYKKGIIVDVRGNHGGQTEYAYYLAGRFLLNSPVNLSRARYKTATGSTELSLSDWVLGYFDKFHWMLGYFDGFYGYLDTRAQGWTVASTDTDLNKIYASGPFQFINKVTLLTSMQTKSAAEFFTAAMKSQPQVKSIGNTTNGMFSGSDLFTLANGNGKWQTNVSVHDTEIYYNGPFQSFEGIGIVPDEKLIPSSFEVGLGRDIHIEAAINYINGYPK